MKYHYLAFGIPVISEIELPALLPVEESETIKNAVHVKLGVTPVELSQPGVYADKNTYCNVDEMIYTVPGCIKFYISKGSQIIIEPINPNYKANLIYFYSNALAAILYQRDMIPFHVSGVFTEPGKVVLFAAPSGTGKSTLAVKLQERGYKPFTDDTAVLFIKNGKCYAQASYPMIRLWGNTLPEQVLLKDSDKEKIYDDGERDKYGFSFHNQFAASPAEVVQIVFLQQEKGATMQQRPLKNTDAFIELSNNVYRCHWIPFLQKNKIQFILISHLLNSVPYTLAVRPENEGFVEGFPRFVENILIKKK